MCVSSPPHAQVCPHLPNGRGFAASPQSQVIPGLYPVPPGALRPLPYPAMLPADESTLVAHGCFGQLPTITTSKLSSSATSLLPTSSEREPFCHAGRISTAAKLGPLKERNETLC